MKHLKDSSKRLLAVVSSAALLLTMLPVMLLPALAAQQAQPETEISFNLGTGFMSNSLLSNGMFESNTSGWSSNTSAVTLSRSNSASYEGSYAATVKMSVISSWFSDANTVGMVSNAVSVTGGTTYQFGAWVKNPGTATSVAYIVLEQSTGTVTWSDTVQGATADWTHLSGIITLDAATTSVTVKILFYHTDNSENTDDTWYVDDAYLVPTTEQLVTSGDSTVNTTFDANIKTWALGQESGTFDGINSAAFRQDTTYTHSGTGSLYVGKDNLNKELYIQSSVRMPVDGGRSYTWGLWYASHDSNSAARVDVVTYDADGNELSVVTGREFVLSRGDYLSDWTKVATTAALPADAAYASYRIVLAEGRAQVFIDDVFGAEATNTLSVGGVTAGETVAVDELLAGYTYSANISGTLATTDLNGNALESLTVSDDTAFTVPSAAVACDFTPSATGELVFTQLATATQDDAGWTAQIVWYPEDETADNNCELVFFRSSIYIGKTVSKAYLQIAAANDHKTIYVNNNGGILNSYINRSVVSETAGYTPTVSNLGKTQSAYTYDLTAYLAGVGTKVIATSAWQGSDTNHGGLIWQMDVAYTDGTTERFGTGLSNTTTTAYKTTELGTTDPNTWYSNNSIESTGWWKNTNASAWTFTAVENRGTPPVAGELGSVAYDWDYDLVTARPTLNVTAAPSAVSVTGGNRASLTVPYTGLSGTLPETVRARLYQDGVYYATVAVKVATDSNGAASGNGLLKASFTAPDYLPSGSYDLCVYESDLNLLGLEDNTLVPVTLTASGRSTITSSVDVKEVTTGTTSEQVTLTVNNREVSPVMYLRPYGTGAAYYDRDELSAFAESDVTLYATYGGYLGDASSTGRGTLWESDGSIHYDVLDEELYEILDINPNAYVMVNLDIDAPAWWMEANPDECYTYGNGETSVSFASTAYREAAAAVVKSIVTYLYTEAPYRHRIFGIRLTGGCTYEWMMNGYSDGYIFDGSEPMIAALNAKLGNTTYTADNVKTAVTAVGNVALIDTTTENGKIAYAYNTLLSQTVTDTLLTFAQTVKEACDDSWIVGGYNGYLWSHTSSIGIGAAHTTADAVLSSDYIDFICSPVNYGERTDGYYPSGMALSESVAAHGKLYFLEQDNRTYSAEITSDSANGIGKTYTVKETLDQLTRDMSVDLVKNNGFWLFDMHGGWFSNSAVTGRVSQLKAEYDISLSLNKGSNSKIAVIVGDDTYDYLVNDVVSGNASTSSRLMEALYADQRAELAKLGTSYDTLAVSNLSHDGAATMLSQYKLFIVLSPFGMSAEEANVIKTAAADGNTILWVYMPGQTESNIEAFTGMDVTVGNTAAPLQAYWTNSTSGDTYVYGAATYSVGPKVAVNSGTALATYADGATAATSVTANGYTSVYSAVPNVPADMLRSLCDDAGVHRYTDDKDAIVESNNSYLSVTTHTSGEIEISLPADAADKQVYSVYTGETLTVKNSTVTVSLAAGETALLRLTDTAVSAQPTDHGGDTGLPAGATNLLTYSDFSAEAADMTGWATSMMGESGTVAGGMLRFDDSSSPKQIVAPAVTILPGATYTLSYYYWVTDMTAEQATFRISVLTTGDKEMVVKDQTVTAVGNGWARASYTFTIPTDYQTVYSTTDTQMRIWIYNSAKANTAKLGTIYYDDFSLVCEQEYIAIDYADKNDTFVQVYYNTNMSGLSGAYSRDNVELASDLSLSGMASSVYYGLTAYLNGTALSMYVLRNSGNANNLYMYIGESTDAPATTKMNEAADGSVLIIPAGTTLEKSTSATTVYFVQDFVLEKSNGKWSKKVTVTDHTTAENGGVHIPDGAVGENLMSNSGFETDLSGYGTNGKGLVTRNEGGYVAFSGISGSSSNAAYDYLYFTPTGIEAGKTYELSYYIWITDATGLSQDMYMTGGVSASGSWLDYALSKGYNGTLDGTTANTDSLTATTTDWTLVTYQWTVPEAASLSGMQIGIRSYGAGLSTFYVDDIALYEVDDGSTTTEISSADGFSFGYNSANGRTYVVITNAEGDFPYTGGNLYSNDPVTVYVDGVETKAYAAGMGTSAPAQAQLFIWDSDYNGMSGGVYDYAGEVLIKAGTSFTYNADTVVFTEDYHLLKVNGAWTNISGATVVDFEMTDENDVNVGSGANQGEGKSYILLGSDEVLDDHATLNWSEFGSFTALVDGAECAAVLTGTDNSYQLQLKIMDSAYLTAGGSESEVGYGHAYYNAKTAVIPAGTVIKVSNTRYLRFPQNYTLCARYNSSTGTISHWEKAKTALMGASATLAEKVHLNFHVYTSASAAANYGVKVRFDYTGKGGETVTEWVKLDTANTDANGYYVFPLESLVAAYMATDVTATLGYGTDATGAEESFLYTEGTMTYSIRDYADAVVTGVYSEAVKTAAKAMVNYGAATQSYFGYDTDNPANSLLAEADRLTDTATALAQIDSIDQYKATVTNRLNGFTGYTLVMVDGTKLRLIFTEAPTAVTVNGKAAEIVRVSDSRWYVEIGGAGASDLDTPITVEATDASGATMTVINLSVLTPARLVARSSAQTDAYRNMMIALILYAQAVNRL